MATVSGCLRGRILRHLGKLHTAGNCVHVSSILVKSAYSYVINICSYMYLHKNTSICSANIPQLMILIDGLKKSIMCICIVYF